MVKCPFKGHALCPWCFLLFMLAPMPTEAEQAQPMSELKTITGFVQNEDLRRVPQARVEVKDQEGNKIVEAIADDTGKFSITVPREGTYSVNATLENLRSEYVVLKIGTETPSPVKLTLVPSTELSLEVVSPLPPLQYKSSSETYALSRKDIESLPRGNNQDVADLLYTLPSAAQNNFRQIHLHQEHGGLQFRIDGVPIPDTISSVFTDVISPRSWERADIQVGGLPAEFGNRNVALIDITSKSGTRPAYGSVQMFGGSNETLNPSFEYGGAGGDKFRFYVLNSALWTNRGLDPPTAGHSVFHDQSQRDQTYLRADYQINNSNNLTWLFLNSVASFRVPTAPGASPDPAFTLPGFTPSPSQDINEIQRENNQYGHMVWRHDLDKSQFFSLAAYIRQTRSTFYEDFNNALAYNGGVANSQDQFALSTGLRADYTNQLTSEHLLKAGAQYDRTQAVIKTRTEAFDNTTGNLVSINEDNRKIGYRQEFYLQDQYTVTEKLTLNIGLRYDLIQAFTKEGLLSPRTGITYAFDKANVAHLFYGRQFTPAPVESVRTLNPQLIGTTAAPAVTQSGTARAERSHYFEAGYNHAFEQTATLQVTGYYKLNRHLLDFGQFGTNPQLVPFNYGYGYQRGIDAAMKLKFTPSLTGQWAVGWGQARAKGLESGQFLLDQDTINAINSRFVFLDHSQFVTSSAELSHTFKERTILTGQMLYGSGLRTGDGTDVNRFHVPSYTVYNVSITHIIPLGGPHKLVLGFDVINLLDQIYAYNIGSGIGFGVTHYGEPRSFFGRVAYSW